MKSAIGLFVMIYYVTGSLILPCANFSLIPHLYDIYCHCQQDEDRDMTPADFVTDHLMNLDAIVDEHAVNDEQAPHNMPVQPEGNSAQLYLLVIDTFIAIGPVTSFPVLFPVVTENYQLDFSPDIFRPPII